MTAGSSNSASPDPDSASSAQSDPFAGRRVAVALSGGVACYKTAIVVSRLAQRGAEVRVLMSPGATHFIGQATLAALSGQAVLTDIWQIDDHPDAQHIGVARWAELLIVAPASANMIAKIAHGRADDVVSLTACALPRRTPALIAPAMNADMWANPAVAENVRRLTELLGHHVVGPESGWQACRTRGVGRMSEPEAILEKAVSLLASGGAG